MLLAGSDLLTGSGASSFTAIADYVIFVTGSIAPLQTLTLTAGSAAYGVSTNDGTLVTQPGSGGATFEQGLTNDGRLEVGSGGATTIAGGYTQGSGGTLQVDLGDPAAYGQLKVSGPVALAGELVASTSGFTPPIGSSYEVVNAGGNTVTGTFGTFAFGSQPYTIRYQTGQVDLVAAAGMDVTTSSLPAGQVGSSYTAALTTSGGVGAVSWAVTGSALPAGLVLHPSTGAITGVPTGPGTTIFDDRDRLQHTDPPDGVRPAVDRRGGGRPGHHHGIAAHRGGRQHLYRDPAHLERGEGTGHVGGHLRIASRRPEPQRRHRGDHRGADRGRHQVVHRDGDRLDQPDPGEGPYQPVDHRRCGAQGDHQDPARGPGGGRLPGNHAGVERRDRARSPGWSEREASRVG